MYSITVSLVARPMTPLTFAVSLRMSARRAAGFLPGAPSGNCSTAIWLPPRASASATGIAATSALLGALAMLLQIAVDRDVQCREQQVVHLRVQLFRVGLQLVERQRAVRIDTLRYWQPRERARDTEERQRKTVCPADAELLQPLLSEHPGERDRGRRRSCRLTERPTYPRGERSARKARRRSPRCAFPHRMHCPLRRRCGEPGRDDLHERTAVDDAVMHLAVERDLAALEPVDDVELPERPRAVEAGLVQLAHACEQLRARAWRLQRQAVHVRGRIDLVIDVQAGHAHRGHRPAGS